MSVIRKHYGDTGLNAFLSIAIIDVIEFFNVGKTMGQNQLVQTILLIVEDFYYFNVEDFKLCFSNAKRGKYGKIYDRIDGNVIYEWLTNYSNERIGTAYPEGNYCPSVATKDERMNGCGEKDFNEFRIEYIAGKIAKNG